MTLTELIAGVEGHEKTLTVFNADEDASSEIREHFADRNVRVRSEQTASGRPGEFITLSTDGDVVAATSLGDFQETITGSVRHIDIDESPYRPILDKLDETMFTSWSIERMTAASREIEDRAWRVGQGSLHAGFQKVSVLKGELDLYDRLGETDVDVHAYAVPDVDPPEDSSFTLHLERSEEIAKSWFVVFDGGESATGRAAKRLTDAEIDDQKCALLAEERGDREFYGFWTYDPGTVDWIIDYLESTYGVIKQ